MLTRRQTALVRFLSVLGLVMGTSRISTVAHAQSSRLTALKAEAVRAVDARATFTQQMRVS